MCLGEGKDLPGSLGGTDPHHRPGCGVLVPPPYLQASPCRPWSRGGSETGVKGSGPQARGGGGVSPQVGAPLISIPHAPQPPLRGREPAASTESCQGS